MKILFQILFILFAKCTPHIGGQAVMGGLIMRNNSYYALAVRTEDSSIIVERKPWIALFHSSLLKIQFVRGFPILVETLINGIKALNRSVTLVESESNSNKTSAIQLFVGLISAIFLQ